jgi:hypothetical protein
MSLLALNGDINKTPISGEQKRTSFNGGTNKTSLSEEAWSIVFTDSVDSIALCGGEASGVNPIHTLLIDINSYLLIDTTHRLKI